MTTATHWYSYNRDGPACHWRNRPTTTDPEAMTCKLSACKRGVQHARDRAARIAREREAG